MRPAVPERPLLAPTHRIVEEPERVVFEYGGEAVVLEGRAAAALLPALLPLLDGTRSVGDVVAWLGEEARQAVEHALELLAAHALVTEGPPLGADAPVPFAAAALLHAANDPAAPPPASASRRLAEAEVAVLGASAAAAELARTLRLSGVGRVETAGWKEAAGAELVVAAPTPAERPQLVAWNKAALAAGTPWLQLLAYDGSFAAIGPLFVPGETCCYECYRSRRAANVAYPDEFWALERARPAPVDAPAVVALLAGLGAIASLRWLLFRDAFSAGVLLALELGESAQLTRHVVHRVPRCRACTTVGSSLPLPWAEAS